MGIFYDIYVSLLRFLELENTSTFIMVFFCVCLLSLFTYYHRFEKVSRKTNSYLPFLSEQILPAKLPTQFSHVRFRHERLPKNDLIHRSQNFYHFMNQRRTMRFFSSETFPIQILQNCILTAGTAPSGAHCQPWTFVIVKDKLIKTQLREIIENEERINYDHRMSREWVQDLNPIVSALHVDNEVVKPYIEDAPYVVIVLKQQYSLINGVKVAHYYPMESVCIATGMLITAIHNANLACLVSTPMGSENAVRVICNRPENERVLFFIPVGYPASDATVPYRDGESLRKRMEDILFVL
eukprot:TRINITY_DN13848_c0_g1_i1.p1 TRINITY_DN13848_c0_g1~~TRINITY_DN13848_c0_g1_i1.p1  ORF type:complete len:297 (-),score=6.09 TRINITY_DN13848_c0_g1_i1:188-1078(-)